MDNIFIERLWRSLKYEAVYLHEMTDGFAAERVIGTWIDFYNAVRPHASLAYRAPAPEVIIPRPAAWPAAQPRPASPAMLPLPHVPALN